MACTRGPKNLYFKQALGPRGLRVAAVRARSRHPSPRRGLPKSKGFDTFPPLRGGAQLQALEHLGVVPWLRGGDVAQRAGGEPEATCLAKYRVRSREYHTRVPGQLEAAVEP